MADAIVITFAGDTDMKAMLEGWAKKEDRSVSWIIRKIIEAEQIRRQTTVESPTEQMQVKSSVVKGEKPWPEYLGTGPGDKAE